MSRSLVHLKMILKQLLIIGLIVMPTPIFANSNIAEKPPMGWNSYDCFGFSVTEAEVKANADYMAEHLKEFGWEYVVVDFLWYGEDYTDSNWQKSKPPINIDEYGRMIPSLDLHPSAADGAGFKPLADYVHSLGLKFGIHLMRGIPWNAVEQDVPIKNTEYTATDIYSNQGLCPWYRGMKTVDMDKPGAQEYYDSLIELYASWGVDYIKIDDIQRGTSNEWHPKEIIGYEKAIEKSGRDIVLSLSPGPASLSNAEFLVEHANLIRISSDVWDNYDKWVKPQFEKCADWAEYTGPGHWPDADMLPLGKISIRSEAAYAHDQKPRYTRLSRDEQITMMTLWSIFRSPLMFGGHLPENDDWTLSLITNKDVLAVNQHSTNNRQIYNRSGIKIWAADVPESDDQYIAFFNTTSTNPKTVTLELADIGISGSVRVRDLWAKSDMGAFTESFSAEINSHGAGLYRLSPDETSDIRNEQSSKPAKFSLLQNYPNPFNPKTEIQYSLPQSGHVKLAVYDLMGHQVAELVNKNQPIGSHRVTFDGSDLSSGLYFYTLEVDKQSQSRTMILTK